MTSAFLILENRIREYLSNPSYLQVRPDDVGPYIQMATYSLRRDLNSQFTQIRHRMGQISTISFLDISVHDPEFSSLHETFLDSLRDINKYLDVLISEIIEKSEKIDENIMLSVKKFIVESARNEKDSINELNYVIDASTAMQNFHGSISTREKIFHFILDVYIVYAIFATALIYNAWFIFFAFSSLFS